MRHLVTCAVLLLARPVAAVAQPSASVTVAAGYAWLHDARNDLDLPAGWGAAVAVPLRSVVSIVGEFGSSERRVSPLGADVTLRVVHVMTGPQIGFRRGPLRQYAQVLAGVVRSTSSGFGITTSENNVAVQPGIGADYRLTPLLSARVQVDSRLLRPRHDESRGTQLRVFAGAVMSLTK
jgi:hypothetical protein